VIPVTRVHHRLSDHIPLENPEEVGGEKFGEPDVPIKKKGSREEDCKYQQIGERGDICQAWRYSRKKKNQSSGSPRATSTLKKRNHEKISQTKKE